MKEVLRWVYTCELPESTQPSDHPLTQYVADKLVPWQPRAIVGEDLTPNKRITLSNTLKRLEERGLLVRYGIGYENGVVTRLAIVGNLNNHSRTTHVGMTGAGARVVLGMTDESFDLEAWEAGRTHSELKSRIEGLDFAFTLVERERIKQMVGSGDDPENRTLQHLKTIDERLGQMTRDEIVQKTRLAYDAVRASLVEAQEEIKNG